MDQPDIPAPQRPGDPVATLTTLADLRDRGVLTADEFVAKKVELIARTGAQQARVRLHQPGPFATRIEEVEIHVDDLDQAYRVLGDVTATDPAARIVNNEQIPDIVNSKLREHVAALGGNAVIKVTYRRGLGFFAHKELTASGTAVVVEAASIPPPPVTNLTEQLQQMRDLHERGALTDAEFLTLKGSLLARL